MLSIEKLSVIAFISLSVSHAAAQGTLVKKRDALKQLQSLEGYWEGPSTLKMNGKEYPFTFYADFRKTAANNGILMYQWFEIPELGKLNSTNLVGVDPHDGMVHWFTVDNMGNTHEHIGEYTDDTHFVMEHKSTRDEKPYAETIELKVSSKDKLWVKSTSFLDGKVESEVEGNFVRKAKK